MLTLFTHTVCLRLMFAAAILALSATASAQSTPLSKRGGIDIDGNNKSVLLVRSTNAAGAPQLLAGRLNANQFQFTPQSDPGANFRLIGVADFDGNGKSDLAFQDVMQGEFGDVKSWNDFASSNERLFRQVKQVWDVQAVGDLDGDGRGDLVWRYVVPNSPDTGVSYIWFTNPTGAPVVRKRGGAPLDWKLLGAADLNGDGAADMVYISPTGAVRVLMATPARTCANYSAGSVPAGFVAMAFADFTGSGRGDILMRNPTNGQMSLISLNATGVSLPAFTGDPDNREVTCTSTISPLPNTLVPLSASDVSWQLYATGDFNGDGTFDLVWLRPDGTLTLWQMNRNGAAPAVVANVGSAPGFVQTPSSAASFAVFQGTTNNIASVAAKNSAAASRFLAQATFGPTIAEINNLAAIGPAAWIESQFAKPQTKHLPAIVAYQNTLAPELQRGQTGFLWSLWKTYTTADDQLRQRVAYSLSQIFVISLNSNLATPYPRGPGNYLDMLGEKAFGNYRDILEGVTYSPMMGIYLSSLRNSKENPATGSVPDENYAREIMQLFSIGLYQLNLDGTLKLDANGKTIESYSNADITGLAKVFTGLSWGGPDASDNRYFGRAIGADPNREIIPMQGYNNYHSTAEKKFLGVTIPASTTANTNADIKIALDTLFNHPNVGPFIGEQLIQRLVTSNPTAGYVSRVATAFNDNGSGVRGDMKAVIRAILLDPEARNLAEANNETGKIREPAVRFIHWMRSFNAKSNDGRFLLGNLSDPSTQLGQTPMLAPSVFNFYRPGYIPSNSKIGSAGLVAPEMQITNETTVAGYLNYMRGVISAGVGAATAGVRDIQPDYNQELLLAADPDALIDRVSLLLVAGKLTPATRTRIRTAVASVNIGTTNPDADRRNRVSIAIYLTMASPEYILQN